MEEKYKVAKDLKFGDAIYASHRGSLNETFDNVRSLSIEEFRGQTYILVNSKFLFKKNGSKGIYVQDSGRISSMNIDGSFNSLNTESQLFSIDKRVAVTHCVNYLLNEHSVISKNISDSIERMERISKRIADFRMV